MTSKKKPHGTLHDKHAMFLRRVVGTAKDNDGNSFEISFSTHVLIRSEKTGQTFSFDWSALVSLAIDEGVNDEKEFS